MSDVRAGVAQVVGSVINALKLQHDNHDLEDHQDIDVEMNVLGAHTVDLDLGDDVSVQNRILSRTYANQTYRTMSTKQYLRHVYQFFYCSARIGSDKSGIPPVLKMH